MGHIVHLALKVDEVEKTGEFYKKVFGFQDAETTQDARPHFAPHDRRRDRLYFDAVRRRHAIGGVEGVGRWALHPSLRDRG